jgi:hypothetical protein
MFSADLATKRRKLDREKTAARITGELAQVRAMLLAGPVTTKQIITATGLSSSVAQRRMRSVGGAWDAQAGCWRL